MNVPSQSSRARRLLPLFTVLASALVVVGCREAADTTAAAPDPLPATVPVVNAAVTGNDTWRFSVQGMHCKGCAGGVRSELLRAKGVAGAAVSLSDSAALVLVDTNVVTAEALAVAFKEAGYEGVRVTP